ncbi:hypothetical protein [Uliginosibacterium sediminicola]|jgi:hypothetical protein|uniref:Uncharacterized protein n=1 Tax=Uliginosibacterium sediminicola TaxID=2024550 RepID=A0ABU9Z284_9RHOO
MAINAEQLTQVARITLSAVTLKDAISEVRQILPGIRASAVDAFDMRNETPVLRIGDRDLFLMQSDGHCWSVTADPGSAVGLVLTQRM